MFFHQNYKIVFSQFATLDAENEYMEVENSRDIESQEQALSVTQPTQSTQIGAQEARRAPRARQPQQINRYVRDALLLNGVYISWGSSCRCLR